MRINGVDGEIETGGDSLDLIIEELRHQTRKNAVRLKFREKSCGSGLFSSGLGGTPYWGKDEPFPVDSGGRDMLFLLQLNLEEIKIKTPLPEKGILQFFIADNYKSECRVVFRDNINHNFDSSAAKGKPSVHSENAFSPVLKCALISFEPVENDFICVNDRAYDRILKNAVKKVTGKNMDGDMYSLFSQHECGRLCEEFTGQGSKLFGNPCFIQDDTREDGDPETLLLQLDTDNEFIRFGDGGCAKFFIKNNDLKNSDFTNVMYSWDCY